MLHKHEEKLANRKMFSVGARFYFVDKTFESAIMMCKYLKGTIPNVLKNVNVVSQLENINTEVEIIINKEMKILELKITSKRSENDRGTKQKSLA